MTNHELTNIKNAFSKYVETFRSVDGRLDSMLDLKLEHSIKVAEEAKALSNELHWSKSDQYLAEALGLTHDIGRFSQFTDFGTFSDSISIDHGERGRQVAEQISMFAGLTNAEQTALLDGIAHHNAREVPPGLSVRSLLFVFMIRDCDKLDIYRIVLDSVKKDGFKDLPAMLPHVNLSRTVSDKMVMEFRKGKSCPLSKVETLGDFLLMQLSWIYDFSYTPTLKQVVNRGILNALLANVEFADPDQNVEKETLRFITDTLQT